jgi:hypothetical protein
MGRVAGLVFVVLTAGCGVAHGADGGKPSGKIARWDAVEALPQNALIEVLREGWAGADACQVESADDIALTCVAERPQGNERLVFPRGSVKDVWVIEQVKNLHIVRWIMAGLEVAVITASGVGSGVFGLVFVGAVVVGAELTYFENSAWRQPPEPPRMRRRPVYSLP